MCAAGLGMQPAWGWAQRQAGVCGSEKREDGPWPEEPDLGAHGALAAMANGDGEAVPCVWQVAIAQVWALANSGARTWQPVHPAPLYSRSGLLPAPCSACKQQPTRKGHPGVSLTRSGSQHGNLQPPPLTHWHYCPRTRCSSVVRHSAASPIIVFKPIPLTAHRSINRAILSSTTLHFLPDASTPAGPGDPFHSPPALDS